MNATDGSNPDMEILIDESELGVLKEIIWAASGSGDNSMAVRTLELLHRQAMEETGYPIRSDFANRAAEILLHSQLNLLDQAILAHDSPYGEEAETIEADLYLGICSAREFMKYIAAENNCIIDDLDELYWGYYTKAALEFSLVHDEARDVIFEGTLMRKRKNETPGETFFRRAAIGLRPQECEGREPGPERAAREIFLQAERNVRSYETSVWGYRGMEAFLRAGRDLREYETVIRSDRAGWSDLAMHPPCSDAGAAVTACILGNILEQQKTTRGATATKSLHEGEHEMTASDKTPGTEPLKPEKNQTNIARYAEQRLQTVLGLNEETARYAARRTLEVLGLR